MIDEWCQFPHLQPRAELRRNQRGEIGRQHIKLAIILPDHRNSREG